MIVKRIDRTEEWFLNSIGFYKRLQEENHLHQTYDAIEFQVHGIKYSRNSKAYLQTRNYLLIKCSRGVTNSTNREPLAKNLTRFRFG